MKEDIAPFGPEWEKEAMKKKKKDLVQLLKKVCSENVEYQFEIRNMNTPYAKAKETNTLKANQLLHRLEHAIKHKDAAGVKKYKTQLWGRVNWDIAENHLRDKWVELWQKTISIINN